MIIPRIIVVDDYEGVKDFNGEKLNKEQIVYLSEKLNDYLESEKGHLEKEGYVYFVKDVNGLIKIGCTGDFQNRSYGLKSYFGDLKLIRLLSCNDMISLERSFHIIFKENRVTGEWFNLKEEDVLNYELGFIESIFEAVDVNEWKPC